MRFQKDFLNMGVVHPQLSKEKIDILQRSNKSNKDDGSPVDVEHHTPPGDEEPTH